MVLHKLKRISGQNRQHPLLSDNLQIEWGGLRKRNCRCVEESNWDVIKPSYDYGGVSGNDVKVVSACELKNVLSIVLGNRS